MLYHLAKYLSEHIDVSGARLMTYVSFRSGAAFILSLLIATIIGKFIIRKLQKLQVGEIIRDLGLEGQMQKTGTPTMGGIIIILSILIPALLFGDLTNVYLQLMIASTLWLGAIGFADDYIKVFRKNKDGLHGRFKIVGQVGIGLIVGLTMYLSPDIVVRENVEVLKNNEIASVHYESGNIKSPSTTIPFVKNNNFNYESIVSFLGEHKTTASWVVFVIITIFVITAVSNGANLTDGLDGLAAGTSAMAGVTLGILAYVSSRIDYAAYLNIMYIPKSEEMVIFASAFIGAIIGFLWYNSYPAQVFMGDTGSLMLGGIIAVFAIIIRKELLIPILCFTFLIENLSVIFQVAYFKRTKAKTGVGRRLFKMTPLHHHFQKPGDGSIDAILQYPRRALPESKIVARFWIIAILMAAFAFITLKIR